MTITRLLRQDRPWAHRAKVRRLERARVLANRRRGRPDNYDGADESGWERYLPWQRVVLCRKCGGYRPQGGYGQFRMCMTCGTYAPEPEPESIGRGAA